MSNLSATRTGPGTGFRPVSHHWTARWVHSSAAASSRVVMPSRVRAARNSAGDMGQIQGSAGMARGEGGRLLGVDIERAATHGDTIASSASVTGVVTKAVKLEIGTKTNGRGHREAVAIYQP